MQRQLFYSLNNLSNLTIEDVETRISELDPDITYLSLSNNTIGLRYLTELSRIVKAIALTLPNLILINLSKNLLGSLTAFELTVFLQDFQKFLPKLKYLDLGANSLCNFNATILQSALDLPGLDVLNLADNNLALVKNLEKIFKPECKGPLFLGLSCNNLGALSQEKMQEFFSVIPDKVEALDLRGNMLLSTPWSSAVDCDGLTNAINCLSKNISFIDMRFNKISDDAALRIISHLPENIKKIGVLSDIVNLDVFWINLLIEIIDNFILRKHAISDFDKLDFPYRIDKKSFFRFIDYLDASNKLLCNFVSGLLLECRLKNIILEDDDNKYCIEKRTHDAITFYMKAAQDKNNLHSLSADILWNIKSTSTISSVKSRLAQYDFYRIKNNPENSVFSSVMTRTELPFANRFRMFPVEHHPETDNHNLSLKGSSVITSNL